MKKYKSKRTRYGAGHITLQELEDIIFCYYAISQEVSNPLAKSLSIQTLNQAIDSYQQATNETEAQMMADRIVARYNQEGDADLGTQNI